MSGLASFLAAVLGVMLIAGVALAATSTVVLNVDGMT